MSRDDDRVPAHCFQILLALAERDGHGAAVVRTVLDQTDGKMRLWPVKLYASLERMVAALRPGGWLLFEDFDPSMQQFACPDAYGPEQRLANKIRDGFRRLLEERGADLEFARRLPRLLRAAGLVEVEADAYMPLALPAGVELEKANVNQVRDQLIAGGHATALEVEEYLGALEARRIDVATAPLISVWGRHL